MLINNRLLAMGGMIEGMLLHYTLLNYKKLYTYHYIVSIGMKKCEQSNICLLITDSKLWVE